MRTQALSAAFVVTAMTGLPVAEARPHLKPRGAAGKRLPTSRTVDPIALHADLTCWQAAEPCAVEGCAADAKVVQVRCPPLPLSADARVSPPQKGPDGSCMAMVSFSCGPTDCGDVPCPPVSCNPPPPQLVDVPCEGEGTAAQVKPVKATLANGDTLEPQLDGQCRQSPAFTPCPEGARCNPPPLRWRPCPSPKALKAEMAPPKAPSTPK